MTFSCFPFFFAEEVSEGPVVDGGSSLVPSFPGHSEPTHPTMGLWGPEDGRARWSEQLWVGDFSYLLAPTIGYFITIINVTDRMVCVCMCMSQAAGREATIDWGRGEKSCGEQANGEEFAHEHTHSHSCSLDKKGAENVLNNLAL